MTTQRCRSLSRSLRRSALPRACLLAGLVRHAPPLVPLVPMRTCSGRALGSSGVQVTMKLDFMEVGFNGPLCCLSFIAQVCHCTFTCQWTALSPRLHAGTGGGTGGAPITHGVPSHDC